MMSRGVRGAMYGLAAGACALAPSMVLAAATCDFTATSCVVRCEPTGGDSVVTFKPKGFSSTAQETVFGVKKADIDGCTADQSMGNDGTGGNQLADWKAADKKFGFVVDPTKSGAIAIARIASSGLGFVNCDAFNISDNTYPPSGKVAIVFLDASGIKTGAKAEAWTTVTIDAATFSAVNAGIVTKGLGVGANIAFSAGVDLSGSTCDTSFTSAKDQQICHDNLANVLACASGDPLDNTCSVASGTTCKTNADCPTGQTCRRPITNLPLTVHTATDFLEITFGDIQSHS